MGCTQCIDWLQFSTRTRQRRLSPSQPIYLSWGDQYGSFPQASGRTCEISLRNILVHGKTITHKSVGTTRVCTVYSLDNEYSHTKHHSRSSL
ncbi:hypothetical protein ACMFMF_002178 [Clarireedia jacksonii]